LWVVFDLFVLYVHHYAKTLFKSIVLSAGWSFGHVYQEIRSAPPATQFPSIARTVIKWWAVFDFFVFYRNHQTHELELELIQTQMAQKQMLQARANNNPPFS
jgi:hypothetical protein